MRWFVAFCRLKIRRLQTCTRRSWQVNSRYLGSYQLTARTSSPKCCKPIQMKGMASNKSDSTPGTDNSATSSQWAFFLAKKSCHWKTRSMSRFWTSLALTPTTQWSASKLTGTITLLQPTTCFTRRPCASKNHLPMWVCRLGVWIARLLLVMSSRPIEHLALTISRIRRQNPNTSVALALAITTTRTRTSSSPWMAVLKPQSSNLTRLRPLQLKSDTRWNFRPK